jgi:hypothetical protein
MRIPRFVLPSDKGEAFYHCMSRTVNGEKLFEEDDREMLRRQMWAVAEFCGVEVITYTIMPNHFHVLVRIPQKRKVSDKELLRRYRLLHPRRNKYQVASLELIEEQLAGNTPEGIAWRERMMRMMCDLSEFMKLFKQRFSIWFNRTHHRFGTLWSERFKSILVEDGYSLLTMAVYIDLNCVRAGLAVDPKDYRFCGYGEAVGGRNVARIGLSRVYGHEGNEWEEVAPRYRAELMGAGSKAKEHKGAISREVFEQAMREDCEVPLATALRCQWRYLSYGVIFGSRDFVARHKADYIVRHHCVRRLLPEGLPPITAWKNLAVLRR